MTQILVTGGAGFIGSHTCKVLAQAGFLPVTYDNLCRGHAEAVKWGPLEIGDIADRNRLDEVIARYRPVAAIHFAAYAYVGESMDDPWLYYDNNVSRTIALLKALNDGGVGNIVFSSSCATYGIPTILPITEDTPQNPINPYGASKLMVERMLADHGNAYGTKWVTLRYFNAAGCDPEGELGEEHDPEPHVIPRCLMAAAGEVDWFEVLGTDYPTSDGSAVRDYVHVCDLATAHVQGVRYLLDGKPSVALNLGSEKGYSVRDLIQVVERVTGRKVPVRTAPRRPGDPPTLIANSDLAARTIGFTRDYPDLDSMIETAWRWRRRRHSDGA